MNILFIVSKLATIVEGKQEAPFSIATTPRCRGGCYSFPGIAPLYPRYVHYIAERTIFKVFGMTRPRIEPRSPRPLVNTLLTRSSLKDLQIFKSSPTLLTYLLYLKQLKVTRKNNKLKWFCQRHQHELNPCYIAWSKQQKALASILTWLKQR